MAKRKEFTRKTRQQIIDRANGKCENKACGAVLKTGEGEVDHILPCALGGDNSPANGRLLCKVCHKPKTKVDVQKTRKADRQRDKSTGAIRSKGKLKSRGFDKSQRASRIEKNSLPPRKLFEAESAALKAIQEHRK